MKGCLGAYVSLNEATTLVEERFCPSVYVRHDGVAKLAAAEQGGEELVKMGQEEALYKVSSVWSARR